MTVQDDRRDRAETHGETRRSTEQPATPLTVETWGTDIHLVGGPALSSLEGSRPAFRCPKTATALADLVNRLRTPASTSA